MNNSADLSNMSDLELASELGVRLVESDNKNKELNNTISEMKKAFEILGIENYQKVIDLNKDKFITNEEIYKLNDLDPEIRDLIYYINKVDGIRTLESCFGHNQGPISILCEADSIETVYKFIYDYFYCNGLVSFKLSLTDTMISDKDFSKVRFAIESDPRYIAYPCTQLIANNLTRTFEEKLGIRRSGYGTERGYCADSFDNESDQSINSNN